MALDDTFRERNVLPKEEVIKICEIDSKAETLDLAGFGAPMSEWAAKAEELGQTIVPRTVYVAQIFEQHEHRVAWVYHSWRRSDEIEEMHHVACDCIGTMDDPDAEIREIMDCPAVLASLEHRAKSVAKTLRMPEVLSQVKRNEDSSKIIPTRIATAKAVIYFILNHDRLHPEGWVANTMSGEHQIPLLSLLMQVQPYPQPGTEELSTLAVSQVVEEMHVDGSLVLADDGVTVSLPIAA